MMNKRKLICALAVIFIFVAILLFLLHYDTNKEETTKYNINDYFVINKEEYNVKLEDEFIEGFLVSTNINHQLYAGQFYKELYKENIDESYKAAYILSKMGNALYDRFGNLKKETLVHKKVLQNKAKEVFESFDINKISNEAFIYNNFEFDCNDNVYCKIKYLDVVLDKTKEYILSQIIKHDKEYYVTNIMRVVIEFDELNNKDKYIIYNLNNEKLYEENNVTTINYDYFIEKVDKSKLNNFKYTFNNDNILEKIEEVYLNNGIITTNYNSNDYALIDSNTYDISLEDDELESFVKSSNNEAFVHELVGSLYNENIDDTFKALYTMHRIYNKMPRADYETLKETASNKNNIEEILIRKDLFISYAKQLFTDFNINSINNSYDILFYATKLDCSDVTYCKSTLPNGTGGPEYSSYYDYSTITTNGKNIIVNNVLYIEFNYETKEDIKINIYDDRNKKPLVTYTKKESEITEQELSYASLLEKVKGKINRLDSYTYYFDDNNKITKIEKK